MREIELKFQVGDLDGVVKKLESLGCKISDVVEQKDTIYVENLNTIESKEGSVWLRVRKTDGIVELNYKKQKKKKSESQEIEFGVLDYEKANLFLQALGYKEWVKVHKKRRYTTYLQATICMDEVERLGSFVEIEFLIEETDHRMDYDYEEELFTIAKKIGIDITKQIYSHYDTMIASLGD